MKFQRSKRYDKIKTFKDAQERIEELDEIIDNMLEDYNERIMSIWIAITFLFFILLITTLLNVI